MGRRGPVAKPGARGNATGKTPVRVALTLAVPSEAKPVPPPPAGLSPDVLAWWGAYWQSDVALADRAEQLPAVRRLFKLYQRFEDAIDAAGLSAEGSQGQPVKDPVGEHALAVSTQILRLETELGLTPMARARLGLTVGQAELTVEQLNRMAAPDAGDVVDLDDPELAAWAAT